MKGAVALLLVAALSACALGPSGPPPYRPSQLTKQAIANGRPAGPVDLTLSGAITAHVTSALAWGDCGYSAPNHDFSVVLLFDIAHVTYALGITIWSYPRKPGEYRLPGQKHIDVSVNFGPFQMLSGNNDGANAPGRVVVDADERGGMVDTPHIPTDHWWPGLHREVSIRGTWRCP